MLIVFSILDFQKFKNIKLKLYEAYNIIYIYIKHYFILHTVNIYLEIKNIVIIIKYLN